MMNLEYIAHVAKDVDGNWIEPHLLVEHLEKVGKLPVNSHLSLILKNGECWQGLFMMLVGKNVMAKISSG